MQNLKRGGGCEQAKSASSTADSIWDYVMGRGGPHRSGTLGPGPLNAIEELYTRPGVSVETGCGASTVLLSKLSRKHVVLCFDDRNEDNSSVRFVTGLPDFRSVAGGIRLRPDTADGADADAAGVRRSGLDRRAAWLPVPGAGILLPLSEASGKGRSSSSTTCRFLPSSIFYQFLREEKMFSLVKRVRYTAFFTRTNAPLFNPLADGWWEQEYIKRRFLVVPRADRAANLFPMWMTHVIPKPWRRALRTYLSRGD